MAIDAGLVKWTFPANGQSTDAANAVAGNVTTTGDKVFFLADANYNVFEVGALIGTATAATTYVFTVATAPLIGGSYTVANTITGPASTAIAAGGALKRSVNIPLAKGACLRFSVTGNPASGTAQFYAILAPAGDPTPHLMGATGNVIEQISTT